MMKRFLFSLAVLSLLLSILLPVAAGPASADGGITIISNTAQAGFPNSVTFSLEAEAPTDIVNISISDNTLFSVRSIASTFPADSSGAKLCYAESYSVVRFLTDNYGSAKLLVLLDAFKQGSTDDEALKQVYGFDTDGLNERWRANLGLGPQLSATPTPVPPSTSSDFVLTAPYIVMIALVFILAAATVCLGAILFRKWR